jgi:hypothetical protein
MPRYAVLFDRDEYVAQWCWRKFNLFPMPYTMAIGIIDTRSNQIEGAAIFYWWNGCNIELNYYGPNTTTLGIVRILGTIAKNRFNATRVTVRTQCENVFKGMKKFGFVEEGIERDFYGIGQDARRLVLFRDGLTRLAGKGAL